MQQKKSNETAIVAAEGSVKAGSSEGVKQTS